MRVLLQRVTEASVTVENEPIGSIRAGFVLFLGVLEGDTGDKALWLADKITKVRLFPGEDGKINDRSILDTGGGILVVSQFTLAGKTEKGNRPDYTAAAKPDVAEKLYDYFLECLRTHGVQNVACGRFGAHMEVRLLNDGPVTLILER